MASLPIRALVTSSLANHLWNQPALSRYPIQKISRRFRSHASHVHYWRGWPVRRKAHQHGPSVYYWIACYQWSCCSAFGFVEGHHIQGLLRNMAGAFPKQDQRNYSPPVAPSFQLCLGRYNYRENRRRLDPRPLQAGWTEKVRRWQELLGRNWTNQTGEHFLFFKG